jgi:hypothetical protein
MLSVLVPYLSCPNIIILGNTLVLQKGKAHLGRDSLPGKVSGQIKVMIFFYTS